MVPAGRKLLNLHNVVQHTIFRKSFWNYPVFTLPCKLVHQPQYLLDDALCKCQPLIAPSIWHVLGTEDSCDLLVQSLLHLRVLGQLMQHEGGCGGGLAGKDSTGGSHPLKYSLSDNTCIHCKIPECLWPRSLG